MSDPVLVDSNVYISLLRRGRDPIEELRQWRSPMDLATCGMVRLEVLRGIRDSTVFNEVAEFLDAMTVVESTSEVWSETAQRAWKMERLGMPLPAPDLLIATSAISIEAAILTSDRHFLSIPGLTVLDPAKELPDWS